MGDLRYYLVTGFTVCVFASQGQILNQDAAGKSSIIWNGSSINIDVAEALVKINHYHTNKHGFIYGFDVQAKKREWACCRV
jgi:hypothetical protein